ncbi:MAG: hypothetical protein IJ512_05145 [Ruminococcus sp.]|nr:hypothetical protein [Ruminococcus sp.]
MQKKISAWVLLLVLHVGMAWLVIAGVRSFQADMAPASQGNAYSGWEKADAALSHSAPGKDSAMRLRTLLSLATGNEKIGSVYISEERLLREPELLDETALAETAAYINAFYQQYTVPVCLAAIPSATEIYTECLPDHAVVPSQLEALDTFYEATDTQIRKIDAYHVLSTFKEDYIYYRTDTSWTSYGAYCVYRNIIRKMGYYPVPYDSYSITHVKNDFRGDLHAECLFDRVTADILDVYTCADSSEIVSMRSFDGSTWKDCALYHYDLLETEDAASFYMGEPQLHVQIQTDVENGKQLLVLKDSYADCMIPFLMQHYAQIDVIDVSCLDRPLSELLEPTAYQQVLILCDADTYADTAVFSYLNGGESND